MREIVPTRLWLDIFGEVAGKPYQCMARQLATYNVTKIAVFDGFEYLSFGAEHGVARFRDVAIDDCGKCWIFLPLKAAWTFKFGLTLHNPGIGGLLAIKGFRFSVDDFAAFFDDDLG